MYELKKYKLQYIYNIIYVIINNYYHYIINDVYVNISHVIWNVVDEAEVGVEWY